MTCGLLAATLDRRERCERPTSRAALKMNERMGVRPWLAHTQADYARTLLTYDGPGDTRLALALLDTAVVTYHELGMPRYEATAAARVRNARV